MNSKLNKLTNAHDLRQTPKNPTKIQSNEINQVLVTYKVPKSCKPATGINILKLLIIATQSTVTGFLSVALVP